MTEPKRTCVVCGEVYWRVLKEPGLLQPLLCFECTVALDEGPIAALEARNQLAPWRHRMLAPDNIELMPLDWKTP